MFRNFWQKKRKLHRAAITATLAAVLGVQTVLVSAASAANMPATSAGVSSALKDLRRQKEENDKKINELSDAKSQLEKSLKSMNSELYTISNSISDIEDQIADNEYEIQEAQLLLEETQKAADAQYESMKLRIQYLYENGREFSLVTVLEAESFADMLVRAEYMMEINAADEQMMDEYEATLADIAAYQQTLDEKKQELAAAQEQLASQQNKLLNSISGTKSAISTKNGELSDSKKASEDLAAQIAAMEEYERQLNAQKAAAAAKELSEARKQKIAEQEAALESTRYNVTPADGEAELLAALIYCEAGGEPYEGQVAVATVVLNRVCSSSFPNSITDVIYANKQFSPVASGKLALVLENGLTTQSCRNAANQVLGGGYSGNWLYFCVNNGAIQGTVISRQVYY